jgi:hypothetical protein
VVNLSLSDREIFVSYASTDRDRVVPLVRALEEAGWSPWWDRTIPPGGRFESIIEEAIDRARCVIVLWSRTSLRSDWVLAEANEGRKRNILLPVLLDDVKMPLGFRSIHAANLVGWSGGPHPELTALIGAVRLLAGSPNVRTARKDGPAQRSVPTGFINYVRREIGLKIVYYGPALGGKTTNLTYIHGSISPKRRGQMISLETQTERTLFFDFLPLDLGKIGGYNVRLHLFTTPGQPQYAASRKLVLQGVCGVVFVADSSISRIDDNLESLEDLRRILDEYGYDFDEMPLVFQYNKRDLPDILSVDSLRSQLNARGAPETETVATTGHGVFDCLKTTAKLVLLSFNNPESLLNRDEQPRR